MTNKGETMTIKIPEADLLALLGEDGERWVQGSWEDGESVCLHGAIRRCQPVAGDAFLVEQVAKRQGWGVEWNDDDGTTWQDTRERLAHVEVTDDDLADTFGPQWEHIVTLVRRSAVLTADDAQTLNAARDAADRDAARVAARDAAGAAARYAAGAAAWYAAGAAAWYAARYAARDAARALVVRDLIGTSGFTQGHYDLLTRPWRTVIGPIHPDDAPMEARRG